jgi:hypothetical protein
MTSEGSTVSSVMAQRSEAIHLAAKERLLRFARHVDGPGYDNSNTKTPPGIGRRLNSVV